MLKSFIDLNKPKFIIYRSKVVINKNRTGAQLSMKFHLRVQRSGIESDTIKNHT